MTNFTQNGLLFDADTFALVVSGLDLGDFTPLDDDTSLESDTELFHGGLPA